jgi:hypothetical protein
MDPSGSHLKVPHVRRVANKEFFKKWTPQMAWVLGVIYTDGCLMKPNRSIKFHLTLAQKEPELIENVLA